MNLKRLIAFVCGVLFCIMANATFGYCQGASPAPSVGVPQVAPSVPAVPGNVMPLWIANTCSKSVDVFIGDQLKCHLPATYKCKLAVPPGRYSIRFKRSDGKIFDDSFELPQTVGGKTRNNGTFLIMEDKVEFGAGIPHLTPPSPLPSSQP